MAYLKMYNRHTESFYHTFFSLNSEKEEEFCLSNNARWTPATFLITSL